MTAWVSRLVELLAKIARLHSDLYALSRNVENLAALTNDLDRRLLVVETTLALEGRAAGKSGKRKRP